ncbi:hypothetical protein [Larkinella arboricola]|nr:hypothetical protein [Larkinella arboricola]
MLKIAGIIVVLGFVFYSVINALTVDGVKSFYCLSDDKCITVWKRANGEVYIIPGRYETNNNPTVSYIRTINKQFLTLYFSDQKELSYKIIVRDEGNLESNQKRYTIKNNAQAEWQFLEYSDKNYKSILYKSNATKFKDVNEETDYLSISIEENYAIDKTGNKLN